ncbi:MAG: hypothetical protein MI861_20540, partial [Pirellulales bacterium]|nr:hypothetical protein [Pirellulales bacterium]
SANTHCRRRLAYPQKQLHALSPILPLPQPADPTKKYQVTYDAWNRIVKVESTNGQTTLVAKYEYDGRDYRLTKLKYDGSGSLASTVDYFYNAAWQCLEEESTPAGGGASTSAEYVWGVRYIDDLVCRDIASERLYALQDRQYKVIALSDTSGNVAERYSYTPYGESTIYDSSFTIRSSSSYDWVYLYTSRRLDEETGFYYFRNRYYHKELGRFCSRDPVGYDGGTWNLVEFVGSKPTNYTDPSGTYFRRILARCIDFIRGKGFEAGQKAAGEIVRGTARKGQPKPYRSPPRKPPVKQRPDPKPPTTKQRDKAAEEYIKRLKDDYLRNQPPGSF